ncbi:MAG: arginine--tRNA ligase [Methylococcales bacterium]|nr:arginine--tRNA ligase [Methylococcales bacterium]
MKQTLKSLIEQAIITLQTQDILDKTLTPKITLERTRDTSHGDFASNIALSLAKSAKMNPKAFAEKIIAALPAHEMVHKVDIAGPGFINFFLNQQALHQIIPQIHQHAEKFGVSNLGAGKKIQVEFVSANPTGPLHVGHGRGAVYGSAVADLLEAVGFEVDREYYVNDAGRQMDILATSIWLRYLDECGEEVSFPVNGYRGQYVYEIAKKLHDDAHNEYRHPANLILEDIPADEAQGGDKEIHIDALIARTKVLLGTQYKDIFQAGLSFILNDIKDDLSSFGIDYHTWFSERQLMDTGAIKKSLTRLENEGFLYTKNGAVWFKSESLGDEKDRVVVRDNGQTTYFASDIAYHLNKLERGYDQIINIWGADHHGYIPRINAALTALGAEAKKLTVLLVQFAVLYRGEEKVSMSTRSGEFVTLRHLREEVGKDAARFFYLMRRSDQHMDFDLKLATSKTNENPVFYVQYAHARICSIFKQMQEQQFICDSKLGMKNLALLTQEHESALLKKLALYPEVLEKAALNYEPHQLVQYLRELATAFHTYYNAHQFLVPDANLRNARLTLIIAIRQVLANGLNLLDIQSPEAM